MKNKDTRYCARGRGHMTDSYELPFCFPLLQHWSCKYRVDFMLVSLFFLDQGAFSYCWLTWNVRISYYRDRPFYLNSIHSGRVGPVLHFTMGHSMVPLSIERRWLRWLWTAVLWFICWSEITCQCQCDCFTNWMWVPQSIIRAAHQQCYGVSNMP